MSHGGSGVLDGEGGGYNFRGGLILGVNFENAQNERRGRTFKTQYWSSM